MRLISISLLCGALTCTLTGLAADSDWENLFDGKSLTGWKASENADTFKVEDGAIVAHGPRAHLFYTGGVYKNFEFEAQVKTRAGANSGIYFHSEFQPDGWPGKGFEVQVNNSATQHGDYLELKKTGSLYGIRNVYKQLAGDDAWFTMRITVRGHNVQIRVNDFLVVDYLQPANLVRGKRLGQGTFALQGHDPESRVSFRNLRVKRLPDSLQVPPGPELDQVQRQVLALSGANFPVIDFHTHLKGGLTLEELLREGRRTGFSHGIAVNCGLGFSITNDAGIRAYFEQMPPAPAFQGMQAEGREWVKLFSPQAIARFDYVFTDAMTLSDETGRRTRLWIKEEVEIKDKQAFMDRLVSAIERILSEEPVDIYVNPTFLPEVIAAEYESLWTPERQQRVVTACVKNGVALEINSRYQLPKAALIKAAKKAGVKFTLGTNNSGREILPNDYGLQMVRECGLTWQDMWMPKPQGSKPIEIRGLKATGTGAL